MERAGASLGALRGLDDPGEEDVDDEHERGGGWRQGHEASEFAFRFWIAVTGRLEDRGVEGIFGWKMAEDQCLGDAGGPGQFAGGCSMKALLGKSLAHSSEDGQAPFRGGKSWQSFAHGRQSKHLLTEGQGLGCCFAMARQRPGGCGARRRELPAVGDSIAEA